MNHSWITPADVLLYRLDAEFYGKEYVEHERLVLSKHADPNLGLRPIGECGRLFSGPFGSKLPSHLYRDRGIPLFRVQNVYPVFPVETNLVFLDDQTHAELKSSEVRQGDLMLSKAGRLGDAALLPSKFTLGNITEHVIGLRPNGTIDPYFLLAALNSKFASKQFERFGIGTLINYLGVVETRSVEVPAPAQPLQRSIGNYLRRAQRMRELAEREAHGLINAIRDALGTPDQTYNGKTSYWTAPQDASTYRLNATEYQPYFLGVERSLRSRFDGVPLRAALVHPRDISGGATPLGATYPESGIGFLRVQNIKPNRIDRGDMAFISHETDEELARSRVREHDIVLSITGYPGTAACVQAEDLPLNMNQHVVRFHLKDEWNPFFVSAFINSEWGYAQVLRRSIGGTRDALDYESVSSILVPSLSRSDQERIGGMADRHAGYFRTSSALVEKAKSAVELLLRGELDEAALKTESEETDDWLAKNPSPHESK